ncbi:hypothetical protein BGZ76_000528 [Entomortierella beljakovae]|nr:hypothetical protein BGZ76_000528 [Entomortierella beljakovae]
MSLSVLSIRFPLLARSRSMVRSISPVASCFSRSYASKSYSKDNQWVQIDDDGVATIGITNHAVKLLGEIGFIQVTETDAYLKGERIADIVSKNGETVLNAVISGKKLKINRDVHMSPKLLNSDPENKGWLCKIMPFEDTKKKEIESLLSEAEYKELIK